MVGGHDTSMALRAACRAMHREADTLLQPHGVTANQFVLMSILAEREGLTQQELATYKPKLVYLDENNNITHTRNTIPVQVA